MTLESTGVKEQLTGGQALVKALRAEGVEVIFGIPGTHVGHIYDALLAEPGIRRIVARHEQGAAFMADGYARATARPGVIIVTGGPGISNAATAISEAYVDSSPLLSISSQVASPYIGLERGNLHEMKDQAGLVQSVVGWYARATQVAEIPALVHEAMRRFKTARPRPAHIEIPTDVLAATAEVSLLAGEEYPRAAGDEGAVAEAVELLRRAERPLIWAGGGVASSGAERELVQLAQLLGAPVMTSVMGKGALPEDHPLALGTSRRLSPAVRAILENSDLALVVGSKLGAMSTDGWRLPLPRNLIQVDIDPASIGQTYPARLGVVGDAKKVLQQLIAGLGDLPPRPSRASQVAEALQEKVRTLWERLPQQMRILQDIRSVLDRDAIIAWDMTLVSYPSTGYFPVYQTRSYLYPFTSATLGFSLPAAIGAKVGQPQRQVVSISGDGGFLFTGQELAAAVQHGLPLVSIVFNDHCFSAVKLGQQHDFGRYVDVDLSPVDYAKLAEAYGARGVKAQPEELKQALAQALGAAGPVLIEVPLSLPLNTPW